MTCRIQIEHINIHIDYKFFNFIGSEYCISMYGKLANALYEGGVDGFLLESLNCWNEAYFALEGVKRAKQVPI